MNSDKAVEPHPASSDSKKNKVNAPKFLAGLWGEALAVKELRALGFTVQWEGGLTHGHDLVAERDGKWWYVQVKTTQSEKGLVHWSRDGSSALSLDGKARKADGAGAFYILVQIHEHGDHELDLDAGMLTIKMPTNAVLVALSATKLAEAVDAERAIYGQTPRSRAGRNGEEPGSLLNPDKLHYPLVTGEHQYLYEFADTL